MATTDPEPDPQHVQQGHDVPQRPTDQQQAQQGIDPTTGQGWEQSAEEARRRIGEQSTQPTPAQPPEQAEPEVVGHEITAEPVVPKPADQGQGQQDPARPAEPGEQRPDPSAGQARTAEGG